MDDDDCLLVRDEDTSLLFSSVVVDDDVAFSLMKSSLAGGGERSSSRLTIDAFIALLFILFYLFDSNSISIASLLLALPFAVISSCLNEATDEACHG